jgi:hypothetical protein
VLSDLAHRPFTDFQHLLQKKGVKQAVDEKHLPHLSYSLSEPAAAILSTPEIHDSQAISYFIPCTVLYSTVHGRGSGDGTVNTNNRKCSRPQIHKFVHLPRLCRFGSLRFCIQRNLTRTSSASAARHSTQCLLQFEEQSGPHRCQSRCSAYEYEHRQLPGRLAYCV